MSIEEHIENLKAMASDMPSDKCSDWIESLMAGVKALEQEPCDDEYIKVPKKALKYRTAGMVAYNVEWLKNHFDIERAVICGAQEPCEDAISMDKTIVQLSHLLSDWDDDWNVAIRKCIETVKIVPPVTTAEKVGHWIDTDNYYQRWKCSECGCHTRDAKPDYCPNCGAKMQEVQE